MVLYAGVAATSSSSIGMAPLEVRESGAKAGGGSGARPGSEGRARMGAEGVASRLSGWWSCRGAACACAVAAASSSAALAALPPLLRAFSLLAVRGEKRPAGLLGADGLWWWEREQQVVTQQAWGGSRLEALQLIQHPHACIRPPAHLSCTALSAAA